MSTLREEAQIVLKIANGGRLNSSEQGISIELVMRMLMQQCHAFMRRDIGKTDGQESPDQSYYTAHESLAVLWDETRRVCYIDLPNGNPVDCRYDEGVWIFPVYGEGIFVRAAQGWCKANPAIAWCEGRHAWELRPGRIIFPMMEKDSVKLVGALIIETGAADPDAPMPMPAGYSSLVQLEVLKLMGLAPRDTVANFKEEK